MIERTDLVEWQIQEKETGLVKCWWTHPFLDWMDTQDFSDKTWLEFGAGLGTAWLRSKCKLVDSIEASNSWSDKAQAECEANGKHNGSIITFERDLRDGVAWEDLPHYMALIPKNKQYDVISIDGIYRTEMVQWAIDHLKGRNGLLICDNFMQDFVWISPAAEEMLAPYKMHRFVQPNHINHEGRPWNTSYWIIP